METAGAISSILLLCAMSWQDFKSRLISAWLLPALGIAMLLSELSDVTGEGVLKNGAVNLTITALIFLFLTAWMSMRERRVVNIIDAHIGLGDLLLFVFLTPVFSPLNFILFFTLGNIIALLVSAVYFTIKPKADRKIPLAGVLGVVLISLVMLRWCGVLDLHFADDEWLINHMN